MRIASLIVTPIVLSGLIAAGCGSSSSKSSATSSPSSAAAPSSTAPAASSSSSSMVVTTKQAKLGTILAAGPKHLTVYLFEGDKGPSSSCSSACAAVWPPVTGKPTAAGKAVASDLGTMTRSDGTIQVTYKGHPLYFFAKDKDDGDTYGEGVKGFGAGWYVLTPAGTKVDNS